MSNNALQEQFTIIYESQSSAIFRFCLLKVSDREQAIDLTQEAFSRLWQSMQKETKIENPRAFLYTVAGRLVIDWYRKKKAMAFGTLTDDDDEEFFDPVDEKTAENLIPSAEGRYLLGKIREISPSYRTAVYLRFVEDLSPKEIGQALGLAANVVSVRINRGMNELRALTGYDEEKRKGDTRNADI